MKKRLIIALFVVLALLLVVLPSCAKHEHDYATQTEVVTAPDCETAGKAKFACECGETIEKDIPATGHAYGEEITVPATCKDNGRKYKVCANCQKEEQIEIIAADKSPTSPYHKFDKEINTPADCKTGTQGEHKWVCSICNTTDPSRTPEYTTPQHKPIAGTEEHGASDATCTVDGISVTVCETCGNILNTVPLPAPGHDWTETSRSEATCGQNAVIYKECGVCGETDEEEIEGTALEHDFENQPVQTKEPTCTEPGYTYKICANCGQEGEETIGAPALTHDFAHDIAEKTIRVEPTCIKDGSEIKICSRCDAQSEPETIPATQIHYVTYEVIGERVEASCHNAAYEVWHCTVDADCTETKNEENLIDNPVAQLDHNLVKVGDPVPSTCVEQGYQLYVCSVCSLGENAGSCTDGCVVKGDLQPLADHVHSQYFEDTFVDSTCVKPATIEFLCENCNERHPYTYPTEGTEDAIPLKAHFTTYRRTQETVAPTCSAEGYTVYRCTTDAECEETENREATRRAEHAFVVYSDGRIVCEVCKITYRDLTTHTDEAIASSAQLQAKIDEINADETLTPEEKEAAIAQAKEDYLGPLVVKDGEGNVIASFDWELIGYGKPTDTPDEITGTTPGDYDEFDLPMNKGIIALTPEVKDGEVTYVIKVTDSEGAVTTYTVELAYNANYDYFEVYVYSGEGEDKAILTAEDTITTNDTFYFDLYECADVAGVEITASADTTIRLYSNEG